MSTSRDKPVASSFFRTCSCPFSGDSGGPEDLPPGCSVPFTGIPGSTTGENLTVDGRTEYQRLKTETEAQRFKRCMDNPDELRLHFNNLTIEDNNSSCTQRYSSPSSSTSVASDLPIMCRLPFTWIPEPVKGSNLTVDGKTEYQQEKTRTEAQWLKRCMDKPEELPLHFNNLTIEDNNSSCTLRYSSPSSSSSKVSDLPDECSVPFTGITESAKKSDLTVDAKTKYQLPRLETEVLCLKEFLDTVNQLPLHLTERSLGVNPAVSTEIYSSTGCSSSEVSDLPVGYSVSYLRIAESVEGNNLTVQQNMEYQHVEMGTTGSSHKSFIPFPLYSFPGQAEASTENVENLRLLPGRKTRRGVNQLMPNTALSTAVRSNYPRLQPDSKVIRQISRQPVFRGRPSESRYDRSRVRREIRRDRRTTEASGTHGRNFLTLHHHAHQSHVPARRKVGNLLSPPQSRRPRGNIGSLAVPHALWSSSVDEFYFHSKRASRLICQKSGRLNAPSTSSSVEDPSARWARRRRFCRKIFTSLTTY